MHASTADVSDEITLVREAISKLLSEHKNAPFGILRETGIQARLMHLLHEDLRVTTTEAKIVRKKEKNGRTIERFKCDPPKRVNRVQLELKIGRPEDDETTTPESNLNSGHHARTDVVVLHKDRVQLTCYPNGPGDIVAAISPEHVLCAIEIKASPTRDPSQREAFAKDIERLLELKKRQPSLHGYFLFLDKSQELYGAWEEESLENIEWGTGAWPGTGKELKPGVRTLEALVNGKRHEKKRKTFGELAQILVRTTLPPNCQAYVEIHGLDLRQEEWEPACWYAYHADKK